VSTTEVTEKVNRHGVKDMIVKKVGVLSIVGMFYAVCCAGAYGVEEIISVSGPGLTIVMLAALPIVYAYPYSMVVSEMTSARPVEGGGIMWVKEAMGEYWFGIMIIVNFLWGLVSNAVYSVLAIQYLGQTVALTPYQAYALKIVLILTFFVINVIGIKGVSNISTIISVAVLFAFIIVAFFGFSNMQTNPVEPFMSDTYEGNVFFTVGAGLGICLWMYSGFDELAIFAGEIDESYRVIPKALMMVIPLMMLTYILPVLAGVGSVGDWQEWTTASDGVGFHTVLEMYAPFGFSIYFVICAILGQCAIYNIVLASSSRMGLILGDEHFGPKALTKLSNKFGTPVVALSAVLVATILLLGTPNHPFDFKFLVLIDVFFSVICGILMLIAIMILKRKIPEEEFKFKVPGGKVVHTIIVIVCLLFCLLIIITNGLDYFLGGFVVMLIMPILYMVGKWIWKGLTVKEPELYPLDPRTKLGYGDLKRTGGYYLGLGAFGFIAGKFLSWYEYYNYGYWVTRDEIGVYEQGIIDSFGDLVQESTYGNIYIPGFYEQLYTSGLFSDIDAMLALIEKFSIGTAIAGVTVLLLNAVICRKKKEEAA